MTYTTLDGEPGTGYFTGPQEATAEDCLKVAKLAATYYGIDANSIKVGTRKPDRVSKGFIHRLYAYTKDGRSAVIEGWYI